MLENSVYKRIFGQKKKFSNDGKKKLSVVKISSGAKSIYREYRGISVKDFTSEFVALSSNSILLLNGNNGEEPQLVKLSPGNRLFFYWFHPDNAVRISIRLGLLSVILGLLSVILSIL